MLSPEETEFLTTWAACAHIPTPPHDATREASPNHTSRAQPKSTLSSSPRSAWAADEHVRFLKAMQVFPTGPWKAIAEYIGTRTPRQARTHAQKHKEKLTRRQRKLERMQSYITPCTATKPTASAATPHCHRHGIPWTPAEKERLQEAVRMYPQGPWRLITAHVGTRTIRQVMSYSYRHRSQFSTPRDDTEEAPVAGSYQSFLESLLSDTPTDCSAIDDMSDTSSVGDACAVHLMGTLMTEESTDDILNSLLFEDLDY